MDLVRSRAIALTIFSMLLAVLVLAGCQIETDDEPAADSSTTPADETPAATSTPPGDEDGEATTPTVVEEETPTAAMDEESPTAEAESGGASEFPVTVTRTDGEELVIEERPERIVSLSPGATDTFFAVGAGDQVVAVDMFSDYPEDAEELPRIDAYQPDPEAVAELDPDLVFVVYDADGVVEILDELDMPVLYLDAPRSIDGLIEQVRLVGRATGNEGEADELADSLEERIDAVTERVAEVDSSPRVYHELDDQYFTAGPGSFVGDLYNLLGATNIAEGAEGDYPQLSEEVILEENPEVIILPSQGEQGEVTPEDVSQRPGWDVIEAVQNDRIYEIDGDIVSRPGPRIIDGLEQLAELLYPEEFASSNELFVSWPDLEIAAAAG